MDIETLIREMVSQFLMGLLIVAVVGVCVYLNALTNLRMGDPWYIRKAIPWVILTIFAAFVVLTLVGVVYLRVG